MNYDPLKLENQLCFPIYACGREIIKKYKPHLDEIGLTYTQYITMMVLWEEKCMNVKSLGQKLYLDSGTLTPLLKKLESEDLVTRKRSHEDERVLVVQITEKGMALREQATEIPKKVGSCLCISTEEAMTLHKVMNQILSGVTCQK